SLNHTGNPAKCTNRKGEHIYVHYEFSDGTGSDPVIHLVYAPNKNSEQCTNSDQQTDGRKIDGFHFGEINSRFSIAFTIVPEKFEHGFFLDKRFNNPYTGIRFLCICGEV